MPHARSTSGRTPTGSARRSGSGWRANRPADPEAVRSQVIVGGPEYEEWAARLHEAGFLAVAWPKEYGGRGLGGLEVAVMNEEFARAGVPRVTRGMGEWLVGPSIIVHGTDEQKARFLPGIVDGTDRYCQGFSEPDAGSDLAGLKTRGVVDGDEIVDHRPEGMDLGRAPGQHDVLPLPHRPRCARSTAGISYVLLPMKRPDGSSNGIELRPIRQITGNANFTETFITEARAPLSNVIGGVQQRLARDHDDARQRAGRQRHDAARAVRAAVLAHRRGGEADRSCR